MQYLDIKTPAAFCHSISGFQPGYFSNFQSSRARTGLRARSTRSPVFATLPGPPPLAVDYFGACADYPFHLSNSE
jgi:hypothetical protein